MPLHQVKCSIELLASINDGERREGYDVVRETWNSDNSDNFERIWQQILHDGISANAGYSAAQVTIAASLGTEISGALQQQPLEGIEIAVKPDPKLFDGRFSNISWLKVMPATMN